MENKKYKMLLASASPRRKELLNSLYINYSIEPSHSEEISNEQTPEKIVMDLASQKARDVYGKTNIHNPFIIGADTIVVFQNKILGKPKSIDEARETLTLLSGQKHFVYTGVSFLSEDHHVNFYEKTDVFFEKIPLDLLEKYLATKDSLDKAGAYGIQGSALAFIEKIQGSYSNVVGLPINKVLINIEKAFLNNKNTKHWRDYFE